MHTDVVRRPEEELCDVCTCIDLEYYLAHPRNSRSDRFNFVGPTAEAQKLGKLSDIWEKKDRCSLCGLVVQALCNRHWEDRTTPELYIKGKDLTECWIYSFVYARDPMQDDATTLRIGIATEMSLTEVCTPLELAGVIQVCWHPDSARTELATGRFMTDMADIDLVRSWLPYCEMHHHELCGLTDPAILDNLQNRPKDLFVIDVRKWCLTRLPADARYVALSYRWPTVGPMFVLQQDNLESLFEEEALGAYIDHLPRKIVDAIRCTFFLGEKYLWVDALCIIQDSYEHKAIQIAQMSKVYSSAVFAIIAAPSIKDGKESYEGLPRYSGAAKQIQQYTAKIQGLHLSVPYDTLYSVVQSSLWNTRAWTFQESLLSPRKLYFTDCQVYFECTCSVFCEDTWTEGLSPQAFFVDGSNTWKMGNPFYLGRSFAGTAEMRRSRYPNHPYFKQDYGSYVSDYSDRQMTQQSDILNAFRGIEDLLGETGQTEFMFGIPLDHLDWALLWTTREHRRRELSQMYLPSWSWAGWYGHKLMDSYHDATQIMPEASFYRLNQSGVATEIEIAITKYANDSGDSSAFGSDNKIFRVPKEYDADAWKRIVPQVVKFGVSQDYVASSYLGCRTTLTRFNVTDEEMPLGTRQRLWANSTNLAVVDNRNRTAGCVLMHNDWITNNTTEESNAFEFILISRSRSIFPSIIPAEHFDQIKFESRDWCLLNVMMVRRKENVVERLGIGFIHEDAWSEANREEAQVIFV